jgi:glyoxylase-like metal-dependent hydrolase (beta-lactamase superfamily II)
MKTNLLCGILLGAVTANGFAADNSIFTYKIGSFEVSMLMEARGNSDSSIILGATNEQLEKYVPDGIYSSQTNAFVIRSPDRIIMVDTGYGREIFNNLKKLGIEADQVDAVLITHLHGDHILGLQKDGKASFPKAVVYVAAQEKASADRNAATALSVYGEKVLTFLPADIDSPGREIFPGIKAFAAFGHTPGHTAYMVESEGQKLLIWGDLVHVQGIQFPLPAIAVRWDADPGSAVAARIRILEYVAKNNIAVAGMHLTYPGMGTVSVAKMGYNFVPLLPR